MAQDKPSKRAIRSAASWVWDWFIEHWPTVIVVVGGAVMTWLGYLSAWLRVYGPVAWGALGIASALVLSLAFFLAGLAKQRFVLVRFAERRAETAGINPLDDHFSKKRIKMSDFFHPFYEPVTATKFQDCELLGPAAVALEGGAFLRSSFVNCEAVIMRADTPVAGVTPFRNCTFERCKFFGITFLLTKDQYMMFKSQTGGGRMRIVSDGTVGNLDT